MKFIEIVGRASTTAFRNGRNLGRNVNACAYEAAGGKVIVKLESNCGPVRGVKPVEFADVAEYEEWKDSCPADLAMLLHGLRLFGCTTCFDRNED